MNPGRLPFSTIATFGVGAYLVGFAFPSAYDVPLLMLAGCGVVAAAADRRPWPNAPPPLVLPVLGFLAATAFSLAAADDIPRGLRLSAPLLPGVLVFLMVSRYCDDGRHIRAVYIALTITALGIAGSVLYTATSHPGLEPTALLRTLASPLLLVPNDVVILALIAPLSASLVLRGRTTVTAILVASSVGASTMAIVLLQSRTAALTLLGALACVAAFRSWRLVAIAVGVATIVLVGIDAARGWPGVGKPDLVANPRIALWLTALAMFRDAPWIGHGPHTFGLLRASYLPGLALPDWLPSDDRVVPWVHNLYLEVLAEQGLVGFLALLALLGSAILRAGRNAREGGPGSEPPLAAGSYAALFGLCGAACVELTLLRHWVVVVLFTLLGIVARPQGPSVAGTHSSRGPKIGNSSGPN